MEFSSQYALALVVLCFTQALVSGHVRRSAEEAGPLEELMREVRAKMQSLSEDWNNFVKSDQVEEVKKVFEEKTKELEERTKKVLDELKRQYETYGPEISTKASEAINETITRLNTTLERLREQTPGAIEEVGAFQDRFTESVKGLVSGHVRRSAEEADPLQELMSQARVQMQSLSEDLDKFFKSAQVEEVKKVFEDKTKELEERIKTVLDELKRRSETYGAEISTKASEAISEFTYRFNYQDLWAQAPEAIEDFGATQDRLTEAFKNTVEIIFTETGKLAKAAGEDAEGVHQALTGLSRSVIQTTVDVMQRLRHDVQETIKKAVSD